jgi:hypothetical protein
MTVQSRRTYTGDEVEHMLAAVTRERDRLAERALAVRGVCLRAQNRIGEFGVVYVVDVLGALDGVS